MFSYQSIRLFFLNILIMVFFMAPQFCNATQEYTISGVVRMNEVSGITMSTNANNLISQNVVIDPTHYYLINSMAYADSLDNSRIYNGVQAYSVKNPQGLYLAIGYRDGGGDHYITDGTKLFDIQHGDSNIDFIASFFTESAKNIAPGSYDLSIPQAFNILEYTGPNQTGFVDYMSLNINVRLIVTASGCAVITPKTIMINWPSISVHDVIFASSVAKKAPITVDCEGSGTSSPMDIYLSSGNGSFNASDGIINTSTDSLGIKLTWADSGAVIPLDRTFQMAAPASGTTKDLSIMAVPVATRSPNIASGDFNSTLTMTIQYH